MEKSGFYRDVFIYIHIPEISLNLFIMDIQNLNTKTNQRSLSIINNYQNYLQIINNVRRMKSNNQTMYTRTTDAQLSKITKIKKRAIMGIFSPSTIKRVPISNFRWQTRK